MSHTGKKIKDIEKELIKGYIEMSGINLEEANLCTQADNEALDAVETQLTECE